MRKEIPIVLTLSGHDPSGGAGIQADIETLFALKCHACSVVTALTDQDTHNVSKIYPQNADRVTKQIETVLNDLPVKVIKIGLIGHVEVALAISECLSQFPEIPVVLDPVLTAGGGYTLTNDDLLAAMKNKLLKQTSILTPNSLEARRLGHGENDLDICAEFILNQGCRHVLITGTHENEKMVINRFYSSMGQRKRFEWPRLPHSYHGSGCTLAASIAGYLALGFEQPGAIEHAQFYTWQALNKGFKPGTGQYIPRRDVGQLPQ